MSTPDGIHSRCAIIADASPQLGDDLGGPARVLGGRNRHSSPLQRDTNPPERALSPSTERVLSWAVAFGGRGADVAVPTAPGRLPFLGHSVAMLRRRHEFTSSLRDHGDVVKVDL